MFSLGHAHRYYLYGESTDMRKSFDGLSGIVQNQLGRSPLSGEVFVFINRQRNRIKLLHWEYGGFVLYYKRLEEGTLELPRFAVDNTGVTAKGVSISFPALLLMIEGVGWQQIKQQNRFQPSVKK